MELFNRRTIIFAALFFSLTIVSLFTYQFIFSQVKQKPISYVMPSQAPATKQTNGNKVKGHSKEDQTSIEFYKDNEEVKTFTLNDLQKLALSLPANLPNRLNKHAVVSLKDILVDLKINKAEKLQINGFKGESVDFKFSDIYSGSENLVLISTFVPSWKLSNLGNKQSLGGQQGGFIIRSVSRITVLSNIDQTVSGGQHGDICSSSKVYTDLQEALKNPSDVCNLSLPDKNLSSLPKEFVSFKNLKVLNLGHNSFTEFPSEILSLNSLIELNLSSNQLKTLPDLSVLVNMQSLKLGRNQISEFPRSLGRLAKVTIVELDNNKLTSLPPEIGGLVSLKDFEFANNQLTSLPEQVENLKNVDEVDLKGNPIPKIEQNNIKSYFPKADIKF